MHWIDKKWRFHGLVAGALLAAPIFTACREAPPEIVQAPPTPPVSTCGNLGILQAKLSGAVIADLDWPDSTMHCESMPRPGAEGVRLRLSGDVGEERVAIIIALPGLHAGATGQEFDSNVTISVEGSGRFFSTPNLDTCWADIAVNKPFEDGSANYNVLGELSCVGPLGELNGDGFVDVRFLRFSGIANWSSE